MASLQSNIPFLACLLAFGAFLRYDTLADATFVDSPLVKKRNAVSAGVAMS